MKIIIILGTAREGRESEKVAKLVCDVAMEQAYEVVFVDPRDLNMDLNSEGIDLAYLNKDFTDKIYDSDAVVIVSPEYNHSFPGILKRMLDMLDAAKCKHKPVAVVGVSNGSFGGVRMMMSLQPVLKYLGFVQIQGFLPFVKVPEVFDSEGKLIDIKYIDRIKKLLKELEEYIKVWDVV